jgi:hypothetical protein
VKRIFAAAVGILVPLLVAPGLALAQDGSGLGPPQGPEVGGVGGSVGGVGGSVGGVGGTAFTGAEIAGLVAFAVALVVIGVVLLALTRRRRASRLEA